MKIAVIGTGYIGLVGAAVFADWGNNVVGIDIDAEKVAKIQRGEMPIFEPGLSELVLKNVDAGRLSFTTSLKDGIHDAEVVFICVGTPQGDDGSADLSYVWAVAKEIGQALDSYKVIVTKSTVPVGTNERVKEIVLENLKQPVAFDVASNPEFLREGFSIDDMRNPDRTVVGFESPDSKAIDVIHRLYAHLESPLVECDLRSAEIIKYASNAFLATKISFINEIGQLCEKAGADVNIVAKGMGLDKRIGPKFLNPGLGYGGSCFPKDVSALYRVSTDQAYDFKLLRGVMEVNELQRDLFFKKVKSYFGEDLAGKTIACLGLAFKQNTDDVRESISIKFVRMLRGMGANVRVFDPEALDTAKKDLGDVAITYCESEYDAAKGADALCILTEWEQFKELDLDKIKTLLTEPVIFDGRNLLDMQRVQEAGFTYFAVGRKTNAMVEHNQNLTKKSYAVLRNGSH
ncbi:UDP-glucose/GDP-mannose dehydrogenase family protein [Patescibacteria group bacterium]|nr:UDP-glucose/GDP-mannose dehydrogenase family protein [Patescibacteria group bacterium]